MPPSTLAYLAPTLGSPDMVWGKLDSNGLRFMLAMQVNYSFVNEQGEVPVESYADLTQWPDGATASGMRDDEITAIRGAWQIVPGSRDPLDREPLREFGFTDELLDATHTVAYNGKYMVLQGYDGVYGFYVLLEKAAD